jgi:hypothetical protein
MNADAPDFPPDPGSWGGPITSPSEFVRIAEDALFEARRLADANPSIWIYQLIASTLEGFLRITANGRRPKASERRSVDPVLQTLRSQAGQADAALLRLTESVLGYFLEWPAGAQLTDHAEPEDADAQAGGEPLLLDAIVPAIHRLRGELAEGRELLSDRVASGSLMARAMREAHQSVDEELKKTLAAIVSWAKSGQAPRRRAVKPAAGMESWRQLVRYLPQHADAIRRIRSSYAAWRKRARHPDGGAAVASFEQLVAALNLAIAEAGELAKVSPDHAAVKKLGDWLQWMRTRAAGWIADLDPPSERETPLAFVLAQDLDLLDWPQLPPVQKGVRELARMLEGWSSEALAYFRSCLYETAIDLDLLRTISVSRALDDVARNVEQLLYRTAEGKEPAPHERKEIDLAKSIARELDIYASPVLPAFLARVRAIDACWQTWTASVTAEDLSMEDHSGRPGPSPAAAPLSRHDAEKQAIAMITKAEAAGESANWAEQDPTNAAGGYSRGYFHHVLDSAVREFKTLPAKFPFSRAVGLQLRAISRWTDRGRTPAPDEKRATASAFAAIWRLTGGEEGAAALPMMHDAFSIHAYFQTWPEDDKTKHWPTTPAGMVAGPEHFAAAVSDLIADVACLLGVWPSHGGWIDAFRQLARMDQCARFGRKLSERERADLDRALASLPAIPADMLTTIPGFAVDFASRVRQAYDYFRGRRVNSRAAFDELLRQVLDETRQVQLGRMWDEDQAPMAAIDRQLRAMRRWAANGRSPAQQEREATRHALQIVSRLRGLDRMQEWAKRVEELSDAFFEGFAEEGDTGRMPVPLGEEEFNLLLDETRRDCRSLSGRALMSRPQGPQVVWDEAAKKLDPIGRMVEKGYVPTQRDRAEIHRTLTGINTGGEQAVPNPCPTIHDFLEDITERLRRIDAYYTWLVTAGRFAGKETASIDAGSLRCVTLGGEMRVAFVRTAGTDPGLYVCVSEKTVTSDRAGGVEFDLMNYLPTSKDLIRLVPCEGWAPAEIRWNAHSDILAYRVPGAQPQIGWCNTREAGERGRVNGAAFAWATKGSSLIGIDLIARSVFRVDAESGATKAVVPLPDDVAPNVPPHLAIAPGGSALALTYGRTDGGIDLALIGFDGARPVMRVRRQFPGAMSVLPFWSNAGEIACLAISAGGSDILCFPSRDGEPEVLYHSDVAEEMIAPAWSITGKFIAFVQAQRNNGGGLVLLDCDSRELIPLLKPRAVRGRLSFGEETICVQGEETAVVLWPRISHRRTPVERF